jgi:hypothetical protein
MYEMQKPAERRLAMISTCANPACNKPFHYLRGGRLYRFDAVSPPDQSADVSNAVSAIGPTYMAVFFWLCKECSSKLSLKFDGRRVSVTPLDTARHGLSRAPVVVVDKFERVAGDLQSQPGD